MLENPKSGETIRVYLIHIDEVVSSILFIDQTSRPLYFVSNKQVGVELRYPQLHKVTMALIYSARTLKHYFQGRVIKVYTEYPLKKIFQIG